MTSLTWIFSSHQFHHDSLQISVPEHVFFLIFFFFRKDLIHSTLWLLSIVLPNLYLSFRSFLSSEYVQLTIKILHKESPSVFLSFGISSQCMTSSSVRKQKPENSEPFLKICLTNSLTVNEQIVPDVWYAQCSSLRFQFDFSPTDFWTTRGQNYFIPFISSNARMRI